MLQEYFTTGKTLSQCIFLPWEGPIVTVPDPDFDFETLVHGGMEEDTLAALDVYDLFDSHSLLSSPLNTLANSHPSSPKPNKYPTSTNSQPDDCSSAEKSHGKQQSHKNCKQKCQEMVKDFMHKLPSWLHSKHTHAAKAITTDFNVADVPHALSGYVGLVKDIWKRKHLLAELVGPKYNFHHCQWLGETPTPVVNREGHIITILAGHPDDLNWEALHHKAVETLERQCPECNLCKDQWKHQCGRFGALSVGILYGGRQMHPQNLHHNRVNTVVLFTLINTLTFLHLASFASSAFVTWVPKTFGHYMTYLQDLLLHDATLVLNWANSIFAATTFNLSL
ncbi:hypothetical protein ARMGADRAFT_1089621 [Armillaria gallica]|uniref:Uncharacterized protein n=1 Tax=Armillaria gallica TaxID=47427 RepID=A0A2H3CJR8_ARMGA|nr:hypothetical protein ARMGADRAFT_1089621 [Armillaria gallica]